VGIFRRGTKGTKATSAETDGKDGAAEASATKGSATKGSAAEGAGAEGTGADTNGAQAARTRLSSEAIRRSGPWDRSEVDKLDGRLDLGALWLTGVPGMELRLEVEEESQNVVGVTAVLGASAVQLQAFAAPRSEGIWEDIRTEIAASITSQGGTADKASGPLGPELRVQMPDKGADGRVVFSPVRFVGVDGPRWFLRAVLSGEAASDESAASTLLDVVRATVVVRGDEAMAPRELLALKLPAQADGEDASAQDLTDEDETEADEHGTASGDNPSSFDDFKPFERGPEITEIH
jgi:hypothetical protein